MTTLCSDFPVSSAALWAATPVLVEAGQVIRTHAEGRWRDAYIDCGPEGYWAPLFYAIGQPPRIPDGLRYFRLMGRIFSPEQPPSTDDKAETFVLGSGRTITARRSGRLYVFANDQLTRYGNNHGRINLAVES